MSYFFYFKDRKIQELKKKKKVEASVCSYGHMGHNLLSRAAIK